MTESRLGIFKLVSIEEAKYIEKRFWMCHLPSHSMSGMANENKLLRRPKTVFYLVY